MDDEAIIIVCAGPPLCLLEGDEAIENQQAGCPLCKRIAIAPDGSEREFQVKTN